jgi:hypothetical protein
MISKEQKKEVLANAAKLSDVEQETTIHCNEEKTYADVYSAAPEEMRMLNDLCKEYPDEYICYGKDDSGLRYKVLRKLITFCKPRTYSPEEKERQKEQMKVNRKNRQGGK